MPNLTWGTHRLPKLPASPGTMPPLPAGPGNMPPLPSTPLTGVPKVGMPAPAALPQAPAPIPAQMVTLPALPDLPPTPLTGAPKVGVSGQLLPAPAKPIWMAARNPSAQMVQQQYVDLRMEELEVDRDPDVERSLKILDLLLRQMPQYQRKRTIFPFPWSASSELLPRKKLKKIYAEMQRNLQSADLTINFHADTFFAGENDSPTYTQMYQRAPVVNGRMELPPTANTKDRAPVDNQVTFPSSWQGAQTPPQRGLSPETQGPARIMRQMDTGALVNSSSGNGFNASNQYFNPDTKQLFFALNFGRRPHGSLAYWGYSHFVLKQELKQRCLYYPGDTFEQKNKSHHADALQTRYDNLGAILGRSEATSKGSTDLYLKLCRDILQACIEAKILPDDPGYARSSIEAHYFGELHFGEHVDYMVLSPKGLVNPSAWDAAVANARKFAQKHGFRLFQTD